MVKISSGDVIAILRRYNVAGEENVPRNVSLLTVSNPEKTSTLASFRFNKLQYFILFDDNAEDDPEYVKNQIEISSINIVGDLIQNPLDTSNFTYGMPFKGKECYLYVQKSEKQRLDLELVNRYPEFSRSTWQKYIKAGYVQVNNEIATSVKQDVLVTDEIAIQIPDATDFSEQSIPIVYIDDNVIVVNKPIGILSHSKGALNDEFTVADFFGRYSTYNLDTNRPGIVHRLDRDTSGIMIGARNPETAEMLQKQFADRKTKKIYTAVIVGEPKNSDAVIDLPIGRNPSSPSTFRVDVKGKSAITNYHVLESDEKQTLVRLEPKTGRTHQLRVHMKYIGTPIKGDRVYGKPADRLYLHASSLEITIPTSDRKTFVASLPDSFVALFPGAS